MEDNMDRVIPLDELDDFEVADGDPDVRGWEVLAADGRRIGEVDNLLIDTAAMKVRYLDVDLDDELIGDANDDRHILIPIGYAQLDENEDHVTVSALNSTDVGTLPAYTHEPLTREYETSLRQRFDTGFKATPERNEDFYAHDHFDEDRFYGSRRRLDEGEARMTLSEEELAISKRQRAAGEVEVEKEVETRHVRENVPTMHEEVVVERRPATPGMAAQPRIEEGEVRVPISEEELVVEKRTVPKEELVVKKQQVVENETVEADLRRERADVHREGNVDDLRRDQR